MKKVLLAILVIAALLIPAIGNTATTEAATDLVRLNMKSYGNHSTTYDNRILSIKPQMLIDNPAHGLYGEMYGYNDSSLLQDCSKFQSVGIKVLGYITCGYEGAGGGDGYSSNWYSLSMQLKLIKNMAELDHVDGVFIDECSEQPDAASRAYLRACTDLAHSYGLITWGNTGVDQFSEWYFTEGGFDFMQSSENWRGQVLSPVQQKWGHRISVTGFNRNYTVDDAVRLTLDAWNKGLAYCYINTVEYVSIAPWFEEYAEALRAAQGGTIPVPPPPTPPPTPTEGNTTGIVASVPIPSGGDNEYNLSLQVTSSTVVTAGEYVWLAATTNDFPGLSQGMTISGNLTNIGWWVLRAVDGGVPSPPPDPDPTDMYVYSITNKIDARGRLKLTVTISEDTDGDKLGETADAELSGVSVTLALRDYTSGNPITVKTFTGTTNLNGKVTFTYRNPSPGQYSAQVTALTKEGYNWNHQILRADNMGWVVV